MMLPRLLLSCSLALLATACTRETTIADHDGKALVDALAAAQSGTGPHRIILARRGSYVLSSPSETGLLLPSITGELTIEGNGAEIRSYTDGAVALLEVGREGNVSLRDLALAEGSDGAERVSGTVLNYGELLLDNARLHDNFVAHGVNGVLNLGRGRIEGETASMLVRQAGRPAP